MVRPFVRLNEPHDGTRPNVPVDDATSAQAHISAAKRTERTYTDFMGDRNLLSFINGTIPSVVFQNHGEAFYILHHAITSGVCPQQGVSVLHVDHHDDLGLPSLPLDTLKPGACKDVEDELDCPLDNANFLLGAHVTTGAIKRLLWVYPSHTLEGRGSPDSNPDGSANRVSPSDHPYTPPHLCVIGTARERPRNGRQFYMHRTVDAQRWGLEEIYPFLTCGSKPGNDKEGSPEWRPGNKDTFPLDAFAAIPGREYEIAILSSEATLTPRWWARMLGNATWFPPPSSLVPSAWVLDIDIDFLVSDDETASNLNQVNESDVPRADMIRGARARKILCMFTKHCDDILEEWLRPPPPKPFITKADVDARLAPIQRLLTRLLPSRPCLVTIARSNEGAFTPLNATLLLEDAVMSMLRAVYSSGVLSVQYLRSALGSRKRTETVYAYLDRLRKSNSSAARRRPPSNDALMQAYSSTH